MKNKNNKLLIIIIIVLAVAAAGFASAAGVMWHKNINTNIRTSAQTQEGESNSIDNATLDSILKAQPLYVSEIKYMYADTSDQLKYDAMSATVFNNSDVNISKFTIAFCAFDENNKPIMIEQPEEENSSAYVRTVSYDFASSTNKRKFIKPGDSFDNVAMYVKNDPQIVTVKACVKSYVSTDNITWENPMYETFKNNYSGKDLTWGDNLSE